MDVSTTSGTVRGERIEISGHDPVERFRGIPYAAAPVGARRFRAPEPPDTWDGVRGCTAYGPICPQIMLPEGLSPFPDLMGRGAPQDEDCLSLNVCTPGVDGGQRPVVVWIHGGAFTSGSSACAIYGGEAFARDGAVYVAINYRVHAFGFLYLDETFGFEGSGNNGILDQIAALRWVQENIAAFGGDPANVTVVGESAGAMSIGTLLAAPAAQGLFRRAVLLSGAAHHTLQTSTADRVARRVLQGVGVEPGDRAALEKVPTGTLMMLAQQLAFMETAALTAGEHEAMKMVFAPVIDGVVLPGRPIDLIAEASASGVEVMIGTCADEYRVFIWGVPAPMRAMIPMPKVADYFPDRDGEVTETYAAARPGAGPDDLASAVAGDMIFTWPAVRLAEVLAGRGDRVWLHEFAWPAPVLDGTLGACHALDVPFVFDDIDHPTLLGAAPPQGLADDLHGAISRFAATGDPHGGRLPQWPAYDVARRATMRLDAEPTLVDDPHASERQLWEGSW